MDYCYQDIVENVKFNISGGITRIEFEEAIPNAWRLIINRGLNLINEFIPQNKLETFDVNITGERRGYIDTINKKVTTISEIVPYSETLDQMWEFYIPENFIRIIGGPTDFQLRTNWATLKSISGTAFTWSENEKKTKIYFDGLPLGCTKVTIRYTADWVLLEDDKTYTIDSIAAEYLLEYCTHAAKYVLENVRKRFDGASQSVVFNTNFESLPEIKELKTKLSDECFMDSYRIL